MIGPLGKLNLKKINWVIVGGESGPGARPILQEWVTDIRDQRVRAKVPFFFKQWGGRTPKAGALWICDEVQGERVWHLRDRGLETRHVPEPPLAGGDGR